MENYRFERRRAYNLACIGLVCVYAFGFGFYFAVGV
jgi:hypothetical protein